MMKNTVLRLTAALLLLLMTLSIASCTLPDVNINVGSGGTSDGSTETSSEESRPPLNPYLAYMQKLNTYDVRPTEVSETPDDSFTDGICNYFYFKIGEIHEVPIYYSNIQDHSSVGTQTITVQSSTSVETMLQTTTDLCITQGIENTLDVSCSGSIGACQDMIIGVAATAGISKSEKTSFTSSVGKSFTEAVSNSVENSTSNSLTLTAEDPVGCYRFVQLAIFDVYAILVCNPEDKTTYYDYCTSVRTDSIHEGWYYGATREEMAMPDKLDEAEKKLSFPLSLSEMKGLYEPLEERRLVRRRSFRSEKEYLIEYWQGEALRLWGDISDLLNSEAISEYGCRNVKITVTYSVRTPKGEAISTMQLYTQQNGERKTITSREVKINTSERSETVTYTLSIEELRLLCAFDTNLYTRFLTSATGTFDLANNDCYVRNYKLTVELT